MTHRSRPELIPRAVRQAVIDCVGGWGLYSVDEIANLFLNEGFERNDDVDLRAAGQRRQEAEAFQAGIDFTSSAQVERYLRVLEQILDDHNQNTVLMATNGEDLAAKRRDKLLRALRRAGTELDDKGRLHLPVHRDLGSLSLIDIPTESDIRLHMGRLSRLEQEPEEMIGAAKELVEATVKHVLLEIDGEVPENQDLPGLSKQALVS